MKTRITELFNIKYPIICSGMTGISRPKLVAAVSNAGGLGILATADLKPDELRSAIKQIRCLTDKPFGANVPFIIPGTEKKTDVVIEEKLDIVNYTLGTGEKLIKAVHEYGGKAVATVTNHKHALSAQKRGADALIVTGHEAAAHGGDVTSLVLIPSISKAVDIPIIGAGGFADGRGLVAALTLGAEGIAMGTRFMNTLESPAHEKMKNMSIEKQIYDTIYSEKIDGLPCRAIRSKAADRLIKDKFYLLTALYHSKEAAKVFGFPWIKLFTGILLSGYEKSKQLAKMANAFPAMRIGMEEGDEEKGVFLMGQVTGLLNDTPTVAEVMERIVAEAEQVKEELAQTI
jgi:enoyl-[acyl-carrier protein] reductase II